MKNLKKIFAIIMLVLVAACSKDGNSAPVSENPLEISSIGPNTGAKNTTVIITGRGFSNNTISNVVTLNGKSCSVLQASTTQLTITIPPKSATGNIKVTVNGNSNESSVFTYIDTVEVSTIAGSTQGFANGQGIEAQFDNPMGICIDASNNLYVADNANQRIRKISPTGLVSTFAGSTFGFAEGQGTAAKFNNATGICIDLAGNLYVTDLSNVKIRKITATGLVSTFAGSTFGLADGQGASAKFKGPFGICIDLAGNLFVADVIEHKIRKITSTGEVTTIAGSTEGFAEGQGTEVQFDAPGDIGIDASGNLFVSDNDNYKIRKITTNGSVSTFVGSTRGFADGQGIAARFLGTQGMAYDSAGNLFVADKGNHKIRKISPTGLVTTLAGTTIGSDDGNVVNAKFNIPYGITMDKNGNIYVADRKNHKIRKITID